MMINDVRAALADDAWLATAAAEVASRPASIARAFAVAARQVGRDPLGDSGWTRDEAARVVLLESLRLPRSDLLAQVRQLYHNGDAAERRAVLRALPGLDVAGECVDLLADALRTNDTRLVAAALGPYARHLDAAAWRQAVLKCVFMGIPLSVVDGLADRADDELAVMLDGLARERWAAHRSMPEDALALLDRLSVR
jgi:hypothetical protein